MILTLSSLAQARTVTFNFTCMNTAAGAALDANNNAPDPEITPPAVHARIEKELVGNEDYLVRLDNGILYEVVTHLQPDGTCKALSVENLY